MRNRCEHGNNKIHCSWCLIKERNALRAENEGLKKIIDELEHDLAKMTANAEMERLRNA